MNDFFIRFNSFAIVGLSHNPGSFSRKAYDFLASQGAELYAVNPQADNIDGQKPYNSIAALPEVQGLIFFTPPRVTKRLLSECQEKGFRYVWFQQGSADRAVFERADELGIKYENSCVFLHHPQSGFPHNLHRFIVNLLGKGK